jgi:hypothetical protein
MKELQEMPYQKIPLTEIKCLRIVYAEIPFEHSVYQFNRESVISIPMTFLIIFGKRRQGLLTILGKVFRRLPTILFLFTQQFYIAAIK